MSFAGVSLIGDGGEASRSAAWDTAADSSDSGYHLLVVRGYSRTKDDTPNGKCIKSQPFSVGGYRWLIEYYPNGSAERYLEFMSLYLSLQEHGLVAEHATTLQFELSFVDQVDEQEASRIRATRSYGISGQFYCGYPRFVRRCFFERSRHLKNDCFTVRCDITVTAMDANTERSSSGVVSLPPSIQQHLSSFLLSGEGADVTFEVGGEMFMAHRAVLAARSPVFKAELYGPMKEGTTTSAIRIVDMEPQVFSSLLSFIYSDSVPDDGDEDDDDEDSDSDDDDDDDQMMLWQHLLVAADIYDLQKLKLICEENLCHYIDATTATSFLELAEQRDCQGLKDACLAFRTYLRKEAINTRVQLLRLDT